MDDDHEHDVSIVCLTVQFLTVPSIARRLIAEENAMAIIFDNLQEHTDAYLACKIFPLLARSANIVWVWSEAPFFDFPHQFFFWTKKRDSFSTAS